MRAYHVGSMYHNSIHLILANGKKLSENMQSKISNSKFDMLWFVIFPHKLFRGFEHFFFISLFTVEMDLASELVWHLDAIHID